MPFRNTCASLNITEKHLFLREDVNLEVSQKIAGPTDQVLEFPTVYQFLKIELFLTLLPPSLHRMVGGTAGFKDRTGEHLFCEGKMTI